MDHSKKWRKIETLGEGGQGKVYRVSKLNVELEKACINSLRGLTGISASVKQNRDHFDEFRKSLFELLKLEDTSNQGALKVLHKFEDSREANLAAERIRREIKAMSENLHSNLMKILDADSDSMWYVSQFYENGTLADNRDMFKGDFVKSLKAIRPLVEAVAKLHKKGYVHRDIKPQNVFLNSNNELILGDFGLIYFEDNQRTRISDKYENVGSRDWMPAWAMGMRIDDLKPNFDVFTLGKLLWSMVSGKAILQLWYFRRDKFNVEKMFPNSRTIKFANPLFEKCVVENEDDCLKNAKMLLSEIDEILKRIEMNVDQIKSVKKKGKIEEIQEKILMTIVHIGDQDYTAEELADRVGISVTKMKHYLDGMDDTGAGLLDVAYYTGGSSEYSLSREGRAYLVENDLI